MNWVGRLCGWHQSVYPICIYQWLLFNPPKWHNSSLFPVLFMGQPEGGPAPQVILKWHPYQVRTGEDWRTGREVRSRRKLSHMQQQLQVGPITRGTRPLAPHAPPQPAQRQHSGNNVHLTSAFWAPEFEQRRNKPHPDSVSADGRWGPPRGGISEVIVHWSRSGHLPSKESQLLPGGRPATTSRPRVSSSTMLFSSSW